MYKRQRTGFGIVDADNPTFVLLADIGFALVMFIVGTHVPVRDRSLRGDLPRSLLRAVVVGVFAAALGAVIAQLFGTGHAPLYAVLMASSSAALGVGAVLAHLSGRLFGQPLSLGVLAAAQLGVPVAAATLGTQQQLLSPGEPSALILGALLTVVATSVAGGIARRRQTSVA